MRNESLVEDLLQRARLQTDAIATLSRVFIAEKDRLRRLGLAAQLAAVRDRVKREVEFEQSEEKDCPKTVNQMKPVGALEAFGVGFILAKIRLVNEEPYAVGQRWHENSLQATIPIGTVMVSMGRSGLLGDVRVLAISRMAREKLQPEAHVIASIRAGGRRLMTPDAFFRLIEDRRQKLLSGPAKAVLMLPGARERPSDQLAENGRL